MKVKGRSFAHIKVTKVQVELFWMSKAARLYFNFYGQYYSLDSYDVDGCCVIEFLDKLATIKEPLTDLLPDDMAKQCLALIPILCHPKLGVMP